MKKIIPFLLLISLCGCSNKGQSPSHIYEKYLNDNLVINSQWKIKLDSLNVFSMDENYRAQIDISIKNMTDNTKTIKISNSYIVREINGAKYKASANLCYSCEYEIESEITESFLFISYIPTDIDENYYLTFDFSNNRYILHLYNEY